MNHHREGTGPPLVLIHGVGHSLRAWDPVLGRLARQFDVIACDSPGFGASVPLRHAGPPTIAAYTDAYEWFFAELGLDRPHVAGNSMGGAIGLELARRGAVRSVTALSPAGFWTPAERWYCQHSLGLIPAIPAPLLPAVHAALRTAPGRAVLLANLFARAGQQLDGDTAVATFDEARAAPALRGALAAFSLYRFQAPDEPFAVPTTVAWGNRDVLLPYWLQAPRARRELPFATHLTLGAGHVPMVDDPGAVAAVIEQTALAARV